MQTADVLTLVAMLAALGAAFFIGRATGIRRDLPAPPQRIVMHHVFDVRVRVASDDEEDDAWKPSRN